MSAVVLLSDPRIARIPIAECGEPLVDLRAVTPLHVDSRQADAEGSFALVRSGLINRLVAAQSLLPRRIRLLMVEGFRPSALQERYFREYQQQLRVENPQWSEEQLYHQASRYISPPEVAPHVAGAAVDLTLIGSTGRELGMGTEVNASPEESNGACYTAAPNVSESARGLRRQLSVALETVGFVNYPTEWWHWSYGDRYWAFTTGAPAARYGPVMALGHGYIRSNPASGGTGSLAT